MEQLFEAFGIDWRLLLINVINFAVLVGGLTYFLYKPITNALETRREKMAQGVRDAEAAEVKLREIEGARSEKLAEAGKEADTILSQARDAGAKKGREMLDAAQAASARAVAEAEVQARELKNQAMEESKQEIAKLIVLGIEKAAISK